MSKVPKFSDARNLCCYLPKIQTKRVCCQKDEKEMQTVKTLITLLLEEQSDLGLHCLPRPKTEGHYGTRNLSFI